MERPLQILHLEDDLYDAELIQETLAGEGIECTIVLVNNHDGFLTAVEQGEFDLILADFALPTFNGREALAIAQEKCPDVPFIFVSGAIGEEMAIESMKQGATDYVLKHRLSGLLPAIHRALREVAERQERRQAVAALDARARQQAAVAELGQQALGNTDLHQLMDRAVALLAQAMEVEYSKLLQLLPDERTLLLVAGVGLHEGLVGQATVDSGPDSQAGYTLASGQPVIVTDLRTETRFTGAPLLHDHFVVSGISIIVPGLERPFGVLGVHSRRLRAFTTDDVNFLQSTAHILATAIERKQREEQLRHSRNQLEAILQGINEGITVQAPDGSLIYANETAASMVGYPSVQALLAVPAAEFLQKFELFDEQDQPVPFTLLPGRLALQGQQPSAVLLHFRPVDGGADRWTVVNATPIFDEQGQVQFAVNIFRDVSERTRLYQAEKEARQTAEAIAVRIASLQVVTAALTEALTPMQVAQVVEEQSIAVLGTRAAATFLLRETPDGQMLEVVHSIGYTTEQVAPLQSFSIDAPLPVTYAVRTGEPVFLPSRAVAAEQFAGFPALTHDEHQSWAVLPLVVDGRMIGAIGLSFAQPQTFDKDDQAFMLSLARQCAQALDRARLYEAEQQARQQAEAAAERTAGLQKVTAALSQALTPAQVVALVIEQSIEILNATAGAVVLCDEEGKALELVHAVGYTAELLAAWQHFPLDAPAPLAEAVRTGEPIFLESVAAAGRYPALTKQMSQSNNQAWASIPLLMEGQTIGGMGLSFAQPQAFAEADRDFMLALGRQCAQALERARLYEAERLARATAEAARFQAETAHNRLEYLTEIGAVLTATLDYLQTLPQVARMTAPRIADWCVVWLAQENENLEMVAVSPDEAHRLPWVTELLAGDTLKSDPVLGPAAVLRTGQEQFYPDVARAFPETVTEGEDVPALTPAAVTSLILAPLEARGRVFGVLGLATAGSGRYLYVDDLTLVKTLARRIALAVDNARLYWEASRLNMELEQRVIERTEALEVSNQRLQEANVQLEEEIQERRRAEERLRQQAAHTAALARAASRLNAELDLETVLAAVCEEAVQALDISFSVVSLYDSQQDALVYAWNYGLPGSFRQHAQPIPRATYETYAQPEAPWLITPDIREKRALPNADLYRQSNVYSMADIGMFRDGQLVGLLTVGSVGQAHQFSENEMGLLQGLASQAAVAIQNARLLQQVRAGREKLRRLTQEVVTIQEEERQRLSRELHDEAGQALTALSISLGLIQRDLPPDLSEIGQRINEAAELTGDTMYQLRLLAHDLRPPSLDSLGLNLTLEGFCREFALRTQLAIDYTGADLPTLPGAVSITFYRLLQEALTNVARHAGARRVNVALGYDGEQISLSVADDGCGFDMRMMQTSVNPQRGNGLLGMQERLALLNGWLELDAQPGRGVRLVAYARLKGDYVNEKRP